MAHTLSLPRQVPPTHHGPTPKCPGELIPDELSLRLWWWKNRRKKSVSTLEKCARPPSLLILFLSVCLGCGDLYGMLVTPCVISISVMSISIAWGDWGVVSQMVQCQGPQVWFRRWRAPLIPSSPKSCHLALPRCHLSSHRVKARPDSPRCLWPMSQLVFVVSGFFLFFFSSPPNQPLKYGKWWCFPQKPWPNPVILFLQQPRRGTRGGISKVGSQESRAEPAPLAVKAGLAQTQ